MSENAVWKLLGLLNMFPVLVRLSN